MATKLHPAWVPLVTAAERGNLQQIDAASRAAILSAHRVILELGLNQRKPRGGTRSAAGRPRKPEAELKPQSLRVRKMRDAKALKLGVTKIVSVKLGEITY